MTDPAQVGGFVLAGGRSTRMGCDKALLRLGGKELVVRAVEQLGSVATHVQIVGGAPELARFGPTLPDKWPGRGPLGGIVTALEAARFEWNLFTAVDTPFIPEEVWRKIVETTGKIGNADASAVIVRSGITEMHDKGRLQPLCAAYRRSTVPILRREFESGQGKVAAAAFAAGVVVYVDFRSEDWFRNINLVEDAVSAGIEANPAGEGYRSEPAVAAGQERRHGE